MNKIDAILITHEHIDHIKYLVSVATKTHAKIYLSEAVYQVLNARLRGELSRLPIYLIKENNRYDLNNIFMIPIKLSHDASSCFGYLFKEIGLGNKTYGYITDTGYIPEEYLSIIANLQVISIESNHDVKMLKESKRSWPLIQRILSDHGHLSNTQCANYLKDFNYQYVRVIILSHLSEECNLESIAYNEILKAFNGQIPCQVLLAKQYEVLPIIEVK